MIHAVIVIMILERILQFNCINKYKFNSFCNEFMKNQAGLR